VSTPLASEEAYVSMVLETLKGLSDRLFASDQLPRDGRLVIMIAAGVAFPGDLTKEDPTFGMQVVCNAGPASIGPLLKGLAASNPIILGGGPDN